MLVWHGAGRRAPARARPRSATQRAAPKCSRNRSHALRAPTSLRKGLQTLKSSASSFCDPIMRSAAPRAPECWRCRQLLRHAAATRAALSSFTRTR